MRPSCRTRRRRSWPGTSMRATGRSYSGRPGKAGTRTAAGGVVPRVGGLGGGGRGAGEAAVPVASGVAWTSRQVAGGGWKGERPAGAGCRRRPVRHRRTAAGQQDGAREQARDEQERSPRARAHASRRVAATSRAAPTSAWKPCSPQQPAEGGEEEEDVAGRGRLAHEPDPPDATAELADAAADLDAEAVQTGRRAQVGIVDALGDAHGGEDGEAVFGVGVEGEAHRLHPGLEGAAVRLVALPAGFEALPRGRGRGRGGGRRSWRWARCGGRRGGCPSRPRAG